MSMCAFLGRRLRALCFFGSISRSFVPSLPFHFTAQSCNFPPAASLTQWPHRVEDEYCGVLSPRGLDICERVTSPPSRQKPALSLYQVGAHFGCRRRRRRRAAPWKLAKSRTGHRLSMGKHFFSYIIWLYELPLAALSAEYLVSIRIVLAPHSSPERSERGCT